MASIQKIQNKKGISYKITVAQGRDSDGKQIRHTTTWTPPQGMTARQAEKEVQKFAVDFEDSIEKGYQLDNRQSFSEYAQYVIDLKERSGAKAKTIESYKFLLRRIEPEIGYMKLSDIRPQHLNSLYKKLSRSGIRTDNVKAAPKDAAAIPALLKEKKLSHEKAAAMSGIASSTVDAICKGKTVSEESAKKLCAALEADHTKLFNLSKDNRPLSNKTLLEYHRCIHSILAQAEKEMLVPYNAAAKATPPKAVQHDPNYFQPCQIADILDALEDEPIKWKTIINLLIVTGCRRGEIAALKWHNIDFKNSKIKIDSTLLYSPDKGVFENSTKTGDTRFLKLPPETMALLHEYRSWYLGMRLKNGDRWNAKTDYCFIKDDGSVMNPDTITSWCNDFSAKHENLPHINPHAFRHTVASTLISAGQDVVTVSKRLGHSRTSTTLDVYSHLIAEADADASECIADILLRKKA